MKHGIKIFEHEQFGKLRIIVIDGVIWFVGIDVAHALGYSNPQRAIRDYVDDTDKRVEKIGTAGGYQKTTLINKSGVYSLILDSNMPKAKEYRHWVTSDVLPQVDETGSYSAVTPSPILVGYDPLHLSLLIERPLNVKPDLPVRVSRAGAPVP